jgi:hypothetical protein
VPSTVKHSILFFKDDLDVIERQFINESILPLFAKNKKEEIFHLIFGMSKDSVLAENGRVNLAATDNILDYNSNEHSPILGRLVKVFDNLSCYLECYVNLDSGIHSKEVRIAFKRSYEESKDLHVCGINFGDLYTRLWREIYPEEQGC